METAAENAIRSLVKKMQEVEIRISQVEFGSAS